MLGYVSGVNASRKGKADYSNGISVKAMIQHVDNYCKAKPLDTFSSALEDLIRELNGR